MSVPTWVIDPAWWLVAGVGLALIIGIIWHGFWYWRHVDRRLARHLDITRYQPDECDWVRDRPRRYLHKTDAELRAGPKLYDWDRDGAA